MTDAVAKKIGASIRTARITKGWTQDRLAAELGLTQTAVSYWESGRRTPAVDDLITVARALDVAPYELLAAEDFDTRRSVEECTLRRRVVLSLPETGAASRASIVGYVTGVIDDRTTVNDDTTARLLAQAIVTSILNRLGIQQA